MAQQIERNRRIAGRIGRKGARGGRPHMPARFSRTRTRLRGDPGHQDGRSGRFCSKAKTAACRQVQRARVAPKFDQNPGKRRTSCAFQPGLKHRRCIPALHEDDACRIKTELPQARRIGRAPLAAQEILPYPEKRLRRQPQCQGQHHSGCLRCVSFCRGIKLVNRRPPDHQARGYRFRMSARGRCICGHRALQFTICSHSGYGRPRVKGRPCMQMLGPRLPLACFTASHLRSIIPPTKPGLVAVWCRSDYSSMPAFVCTSRGLSSPRPSVCGGGCRSRRRIGRLPSRPVDVFPKT
jgi:hypothetical protein